jgi:hypothetical protein
MDPSLIYELVLVHDAIGGGEVVVDVVDLVYICNFGVVQGFDHELEAVESITLMY